VQRMLRAHPELVADAVQNLKDPFLKAVHGPRPAPVRPVPARPAGRRPLRRWRAAAQRRGTARRHRDAADCDRRTGDQAAQGAASFQPRRRALSLSSGRPTSETSACLTSTRDRDALE
jgi:hypothetical protein